MEQIHEGLAKVSDAIVEYVNGVAVLKVFGRSSQGFGRFAHRSEEFLNDFERLVGSQMSPVHRCGVSLRCGCRRV